MSDIYDTYEDWDDEAKDSPLALVGIVVMALTSAAIIGNALFMQPTSSKIEMMNRAVEEASEPQFTGTVAQNKGKTKEAPGKGKALTLAIQRQLTMAGYYVGPVDGMEGTQTREAIAAYQDANGMQVDGRVSVALYDILTGRKQAPQKTTNIIVKKQSLQIRPIEPEMLASLPKAKPRAPALSPKRQGHEKSTKSVTAGRVDIARGPVPPAPIPTNNPDPMLAKVQEALKKFGYGDLTVDGLMGSRTRSAIADFQRSRGHLATGRVNDRLLQELMIMGYLDLG